MLVGRPALPGEFVGRAEEVGDIVSRIKSKIGYNLMLVGYRRVGKSSILKKAEDLLSGEKKIVVVNFDVQHNMGEPKAFFKSLQAQIFDAYVKKLGTAGKIKARTRSLDPISKITDALASKRIKGVGIDISTDVSGTIHVVPKLDLADKGDYRGIFDAVFATVNALADKSGMKFVIILDEFQDLTRLRRYGGLKDIPDLFRGVLQQRSKNVSYVICGSHVHMMKELLADGRSSLFQHFHQVPIGEMSKQDSMMLFRKYLKDRGMRPDRSVALEAYDLVGGHPFYLMALAEQWEPGLLLGDLLAKSLSSPVGIFRLYVDYVLSESMAHARGGPVLHSVLSEIAKSDAGLSYAEIGRRLNMPASSVVPYLNELVRADLVIKDGTFTIRDRIVLMYLRDDY